MQNPEQTQVVVIGGGPAGSSAATLVAQSGASVVLLDREQFPRFRIGESLMPATYWTLERLGVLDKMKSEKFVKKHSVQFFSGEGRGSLPFYFHEFDPHESSQTWQVERGAFDLMLLQHAAESGVDVRQQANVKDVLTDGRRVIGVDVEYADGTRRSLKSDAVIDASGQTALIARKLGLKKVDPKLRHAAIYTRYRGAQRETGLDEGATLVLHSRTEGVWFWYIPLPDDVISVGVVGPVDYLLKARAGGPQAIYDDEVRKCPALLPRIENATRLTPPAAIRDFSYISTKIAGDGWVLAGDAFGFLDPIYSTGVFLALKSGEFAADAVIDAIAHRDYSADRLGRHGDEYLAGMEAMRKLVYAYYDPDFSLPGFLKKFPECREHVVNLLVGNVFRKDCNGLFESMATMCELPDARTLMTEGQPR